MILPKASGEVIDKYYEGLPVVKIEDTIELFKAEYEQVKNDDERMAALDKLVEAANIFRLQLSWTMAKRT